MYFHVLRAYVLVWCLNGELLNGDELAAELPAFVCVCVCVQASHRPGSAIIIQ